MRREVRAWGAGLFAEADVLLNLRPLARDHCSPLLKDIEHAIFAASAG